MRKIKEILRLRYEAGLGLRGISQSLNIGYGTVVDYIKRAEQANISWPIRSDLDERDLGLLLFPTQPVTGQRRFSEPDYMCCFVELKKSPRQKNSWVVIGTGNAPSA